MTVDHRRTLTALLASAEFARAFSIAAVGTIAATHLVESLAGRATLVAIIAAECVIAAAVLVVRREELSLLRSAPFTLLAFLGLALASVFWSTDPPSSLLRWLSLAAIALLAITIGHIRDTVQTVRIVGDVARALLAVSLGVEVLAGVLLDMPIPFLGVRGDIASLGPIQGVFGTRNMLGFFSVVALITFVIEWRTRSIPTRLAVVSVILASSMALLSASPSVFVLVLCVGVLAAVLYLVRRLPEHRRTTAQWVLAAAGAVGGIILWTQRSVVIGRLGAADDLSMRTELWRMTEFYVQRQPVQGWGWFGPWDTRESPFVIINWLLQEQHSTALNAFVDVLLQLGWSGVVIFALFFTLTFARSWVDASRRRAVVHAWIPLMVSALAVVSLFESFTLFGIGWLLLVVCAVRAGQSRSWRSLFERRDVDHDPLPSATGEPRKGR